MFKKTIIATAIALVSTGAMAHPGTVQGNVNSASMAQSYATNGGSATMKTNGFETVTSTINGGHSSVAGTLLGVSAAGATSSIKGTVDTAGTVCAEGFVTGNARGSALTNAGGYGRVEGNTYDSSSITNVGSVKVDTWGQGFAQNRVGAAVELPAAGQGSVVASNSASTTFASKADAGFVYTPAVKLFGVTILPATLAVTGKTGAESTSTASKLVGTTNGTGVTTGSFTEAGNDVTADAEGTGMVRLNLDSNWTLGPISCGLQSATCASKPQ